MKGKEKWLTQMNKVRERRERRRKGEEAFLTAREADPSQREGQWNLRRCRCALRLLPPTPPTHIWLPIDLKKKKKQKR